MKHCRLHKILVIIASALLLGAGAARAQSSRGELSVTATVVASVGVEISPDGKPTVIAANSPDPRDNVSRLLPAGAQETETGKAKKPAKKADHHK